MSTARKLDVAMSSVMGGVLAHADEQSRRRKAAHGYKYIAVLATGTVQTFGVEPVPSDIGGFYAWPGYSGSRYALKTKTLVDSPYGMKARELDEADAAALEAVDGEIADLHKKLKVLKEERSSLCDRAFARGKKVRIP